MPVGPFTQASVQALKTLFVSRGESRTNQEILKVWDLIAKLKYTLKKREFGHTQERLHAVRFGVSIFTGFFNQRVEYSKRFLEKSEDFSEPWRHSFLHQIQMFPELSWCWWVNEQPFKKKLSHL